MIKTPASKKRKSEVTEQEQSKSLSEEKEQTVPEVIFSPPFIPYEEHKKIRLEKKHKKELKSFLLNKGFNAKRFGRMSTQTMEKHVEDFKFKDSMKDKDIEFVKEFEEAVNKSK